MTGAGSAEPAAVVIKCVVTAGCRFSGSLPGLGTEELDRAGFRGRSPGVHLSSTRRPPRTIPDTARPGGRVAAAHVRVRRARQPSIASALSCRARPRFSICAFARCTR